MNNNNNNAFLIAGSIVAAGALIAVGIYFAPTNSQQTANNTQNNEAGELNTASIDNAPISEEDYVRGNSNAAVTIFDYSDLECPFCKRFHQTMKELQGKYSGDELAWVYRHFPLEQLHSKAPAEAHATECAADLGGEEAFWQYTDRIFEATPSNNGLDLDRLPEFAEEIGLDRQAFVQCQDSNRHKQKVQDDLTDARNAGGSGTPYVIIQLNEEPSEATESFMKEIVRRINDQSRSDRITINEDATKIASSGALPSQVIDRIIQLATGSSGSATTTTSLK